MLMGPGPRRSGSRVESKRLFKVYYEGRFVGFQQASTRWEAQDRFINQNSDKKLDRKKLSAR